MPDAALISDLTWRSLEMQKKVFPDMPHFIAPDEIKTMLRPSRRAKTLKIHVLSLAIIADNEKDLAEVVALIYGKNATLKCKETGKEYNRSGKNSCQIGEDWRTARRTGAAKRGGQAKAKKDERMFWEGFNKIADRWHLPAKGENASPVLLKEADISRNTVRAYLGYTREEWQKLSQAKRERILERNSWKGNRDDN